MEKNTLRLLAILEVVVIVFAGIAYFQLYDAKHASANSTSTTSSNNTTYPAGSLAGDTLIYQVCNITGESNSSFNVPNGTECLTFLMYSNNSVDRACIVNSTGELRTLLLIPYTSEHVLLDRIPFYHQITGSNTKNWHITFKINMEKGGSFYFEIYAANSIRQ